MHTDLATGLGIGAALLGYGLGRAAIIMATAWANRPHPGAAGKET